MKTKRFKNKRLTGVCISLLMLWFGLLFIEAEADLEQIPTYSFDVYKQVEDYGENIDKLLIRTDAEFSRDGLAAAEFVITETTTNNGRPITPRSIVVSEVYPVDVDLNPINSSSMLMLEIEHSYERALPTNQFDIKTMQLRMLDLSFEIDLSGKLTAVDGRIIKAANFVQDKMINPILDRFEYGTDQNLSYRYFVPEAVDSGNPLVIWLHGTGEGGKDNIAHVSANRGGVAFADPDIIGSEQAYVLSIQTSYNWLFWNFTEDIQQVVENFVAEHPLIDRERIYIAGCSAGGYQVWKNIIAYPDYYAAAIPICPAYNPSIEELERVKQVPIWLTHSSSDPIVPVCNSRQAYERLKEQNGNVHYTELADIKKEGADYMDHFSWVPTLANQPYDLRTGERIMQWLFRQNRSQEPVELPDLPFDGTIKVEAEDYTAAHFAVDIEPFGLQEQAIAGMSFHPGAYTEYTIYVPTAGAYQLQFRAANGWNEIKDFVNVYVNRIFQDTEIDIARTGCGYGQGQWHQYVETEKAIIELPRGLVKIKFEKNSLYYPNIDWFMLYKISK